MDEELEKLLNQSKLYTESRATLNFAKADWHREKIRRSVLVRRGVFGGFVGVGLGLTLNYLRSEQ